ncbi:MAG TPA: hypothetical protein VG318_09160 [Actinomycetota bacterium]|nr:hypothetical protein [Actinomycetota bacterium]
MTVDRKAEDRASKSSVGVVERLIAVLGLPILLLAVVVLGRSARPEPDARVVRFDTFDDGVGGVWSHQEVTTARFKPTSATQAELDPRSKRSFLGPFAAETVDLSLEELPDHAAITITFDFFAIGSWDGNNVENGPDRFQLRADDDDEPFFDASFTNGGPGGITKQSYPFQFTEMRCPGTTGSSEYETLGFDFRSSPHNSVYRITRTFPHRGETLRVRFTGYGLSASSTDESWGLDNVAVTTSTQLEPNPEPDWATQCNPLTE